MKQQEIRLGDKVKDKYTGFSGIVMAKTEYINGCVQYLVCEKYDKKKASVEMPTMEMSIDSQSLELVDKKFRVPTKEEIEMAKETMEELEDDDEEETGGPSQRIVRRNY